jgi:hypothetical protein
MIAMMHSSTSSGNTLGYDLGDKKDKDQQVHVIHTEGVLISPRDVRTLNAGWNPWDKDQRKMVKGVATRVASSLSKQFDSQAALNSRVKYNTGHLIISHPNYDQPRLEQLARTMGCDIYGVYKKLNLEIMQKLNLLNTQFVMVHHKGTHCSHDHIAFNRVQYDGKVVDSSFIKLRCQEAAAEVSKKYGLTVAELGLRKGLSVYDDLRRDVMECLDNALSIPGFRMLLEEKGIDVKFTFRSSELKGISFSRGGAPISGSKLDRSLSGPNVKQAIIENREEAMMVKESMQQKQSRGIKM